MCIMEESKNWVDVLSAKLERIVKHNDKFSIPSSHFTIFHSSRIPSVTITSYLERIVRYSPSSTDSLILAMIYIDRVVQLAPHLRLCSHSIHRMLITSIMLASKFYDDGFYTNAYYAKVGGLLTSELNTLEVNFLFLIRFTLYVTPDAYVTYKDDLLRNRTVTPIPPSIHTPHNNSNSPSFSPLNSKLNFLSLPVPTIYPFTPFVVSPPTLTTSSSASPPLPDFSSHFSSPTDHQQPHITRTPPDHLSSFFDMNINISNNNNNNNNSNLSHPITTPVSRAILSNDHAPFQHSHPFTPTLLPHHPPIVSCQPQPQPQPHTQNFQKQYPQFSHSNFPVYYYPSPPLYFTPSPPLIGHNFPISTHQQHQQHQIPPQTTPPLHYQFLNPAHNSMPSQPLYQPTLPPTQPLNTANPSYQALFFPYFPLYTPQPTPTHSMSIEPNLNLKAPNFTHNVNVMPYPVYSFPNNNNHNNSNNNINNRECVDFQISPPFPHIPSHLFNDVHLSSTRVEIAEGFYTPFSPSINLLHEKEM